MPNSRLPDAIETSRSKYKGLTARFLKWLSCHAEDMNISSLDELGDGSGDQPVGSGPKNRSKSAKGGKGRGKKPPGLSIPQEPKFQTVFTVSQLVRLAEKITQITNSKVPEAAFTVLEQIIGLREEVGAFYSQEQIKNVQDIESNNRHRHFISSLREIHRLLKLCPTSRPDNALVKFEDFMSLLGLEDTFGSEASDAGPTGLDDEWLPDHLKEKARNRKEKPATSVKDRPLSEFSLHADENDGKDETEILAWMFFHDVTRLRDHVRGLWEQYSRKEISLVSASFLTTQTVELVKEMEEDFRLSHSQSFPGGKAEYLDLIKVMFHMDPLLDIRTVVQGLIEMDYPTVNFTMMRAFHAIWQFGLTVKPNSVSAPNNFLPKFDPKLDRTTMDEEELVVEDVAILTRHLAEVATQCQLSFTSAGRQAKAMDATTIDEHALVKDMRPFIVNRSRPIPFHLIFQWIVYKDLVIVNRKHLERPLDELHKVARHVILSAKAWLENYDRRFYTDNDVDSIRVEIKQYIRQIQTHVLTDRLGAWKSSNAVTNLAPFQIWYFNPWACGAALFQVILAIHHLMVQILNGTGYLGAVAQLYHGLRMHGRIEESWLEMDKLVDIVKEHAFNGHLPQKDFCAASFYGFMGSDPGLSQGRVTAGFNSNGYGSGVLPKDFGGSLLGRLSEKNRYRLTDQIVAKLFPHVIGDGALTQSSKTGSSSSSKRLRFGGKRCDMLTFLGALKERIARDITDTALCLDLFAVQRMSLAILRRWDGRATTQFTKCFGRYKERPTQIAFLPGFLFAAMEGRPVAINNAGYFEEIVEEAVRSLEEGQEDLGNSLKGGAKMFFVD